MLEEINEHNQRKAYAYDSVTGEYLGVVWADPDQKNEGNYLLPANATFTPLDDAEDGYVNIFKDGKKQQVIDKRGSEYYNTQGDVITITELGVDIPEGALLEKPVIEPTMAELAESIRSERDSLLSAISWRYERYERETRLNTTPTDNIETLDIYAQALADITEQEGFPTTISWPSLNA